MIDWKNVMDYEAPEKLPPVNRPDREFLARRNSFNENEARNRLLGLQGEEFVLNLEREKLTDLGREDLAGEVKWSSKEEGDGLGYDIRSFQTEEDHVRDEEHFIEVKTTSSGKYQPFFISDNEVEFSKQYALSYSLYRIYEFHKLPRCFILAGAIDDHVYLNPTSFRASWN